jgi:hypothetical protein
MARVTYDDLLNAVLAAAPVPPGPEWQTALELRAAAEKQGSKLCQSAMARRLRLLTKEGKIETLKAPRRGTGTGVAVYYKLKPNGKS